MCGIAGAFAYGDSGGKVDVDDLIAISDQMAHRGPDDQGLWCSPDASVVLAHKRLAIIDLSPSGRQPMFSADGRLAIVFNGEIYNYRALRSMLSARGVQLRTQTDTEVILGLYQEFGDDAVHHLRGMFAFALYDLSAKRLLLSRDHFGIKPLYVYDDGSTIRFASQVKALLRSGHVDNKVSPAGVVGFFQWGWVPEPYTLYENIRSVPSGGRCVFHANGRKSTSTFFSIAEELEHAKLERPLPAGERRAYLAHALRDAVSHHLVADVPVGVFLSAGLDSSTVAGFAATAARHPLQTVTLGFEEFRGRPEDEVLLAEQYAARCKASHSTTILDRDKFQEEFDRIVQYMDQPSIDGVNTYLVSKVAAERGLKVALSGLGGDELFGGYPSFSQAPRLARATRFARAAPGFGRALRKLVAPFVSLFASPKYASVLEYGTTLPGAYMLRRALYLPWEIRELLDPELARMGLEQLDTEHELAAAARGPASPHAQVTSLELSMYLRSQLLRDADWAGMAHSLEIRVPFVDIVLFRALAPLIVTEPPTKAEMAGSNPIPVSDSHLKRSKTGFAVPVKNWVAGNSGTRANPGAAARNWADVILPWAFRMRTMLITPDAYGGHGGIALYNQDICEALLARPHMHKGLTVFPRTMRNLDVQPPGDIDFRADAVGSKGIYTAKVLWAALRKPPQQLVLCGHINLLPISWMVSAISRCPLVLLIYGIDAWQAPSRILSRLLLRRVDTVISISQVTAGRFQAWSGVLTEKLRILPNAIHLERYGALPPPPHLVEKFGLTGKRTLLTLGRLAAAERYKGFDCVLDAMPLLLAKVPNLVYVIAGDGADAERLKAKVQSMGLTDVVKFTGYIHEPDKASHFRLADVFVMPSKGEGFGFVFLEALACGVPVIASRIDGGREALRDGELGVLVDPDDQCELVEAITSALDAPKGPIPPGLSYFSHERFSERLAAILDQVVCASRKGEIQPRRGNFVETAT